MSAKYSNIEVRPATSDDCAAIGKFGAELVALHHIWDADRFISASSKTPDLYGNYLASQLCKPEVVILAAVQAGAVCGYTFAAMEGSDYMALRGPAGIIHDIFVEPQQRRQGVGRTLLESTAAALRQRGATQIVLSTAYRNEPGQRLFTSAGYRPTMVEMTLQLSPVEEST